ncbi:helix-turn-helix transcriptional regulator [Sphingobacterium corticibacterium]|uniref:AraC family transcriptional regulator n=1 Tax=Sphingobacterium corticibacterium TaxID=2484746 RepID=A0A4Q6XFT9_9SPHI|nr:AraC family transcriptional regulator [Sphingobacterium corticibacterium]RZF58721.1 AraC family transcriptional regulator [Sphingobacterium corticibacterium]
MLTSNFFCLQQRIIPSTRTIEGGYLSFLPLNHHYRIGNSLDAIFIELEECVLLELKGTIDPAGFRVDPAMEGISFWQMYQFRNTSQLYLPHSLPLSDNRCISFSTAAQKVPLLLNQGKQWTVLIGYKTDAVADLLKEFPMLASLVYRNESPKTNAYWEPDISVNHSLRDAWNRLSRPEYLPFRGKGELLLDVCRLLEEYCRQLDRQADQNERSRLGLYHKALAYINENLLDSINKHDVAEGLGVSWRTLNRAFEGRPVKIAEYIQRTKLNQAKNLLYEGEMTVDQISNLLNYPNRKYFSREFKKYFFQTPSSFQKEMGEFRKGNEEEE